MSDPVVESQFLKEVRLAFDDLLQKGLLAVASSEYDEKAFGNSAVVLGGQNFQVRLVWERGDEFADARSPAWPEWRPLERVLRAVGVGSAPPEGLLSVAQTAELIHEHVSALETGLSRESLGETERALANLDAEAARRAEERWGRKD
jgi:hypothetical protein